MSIAFNYFTHHSCCCPRYIKERRYHLREPVTVFKVNLIRHQLRYLINKAEKLVLIGLPSFINDDDVNTFAQGTFQRYPRPRHAFFIAKAKAKATTHWNMQSRVLNNLWNGAERSENWCSTALGDAYSSCHGSRALRQSALDICQYIPANEKTGLSLRFHTPRICKH